MKSTFFVIFCLLCAAKTVFTQSSARLTKIAKPDSAVIRPGLNDVSSSPLILLQPSNQTVCEGNTVNFTSEASGLPAPTAQWQESNNNGDSWIDIPGATLSTYSFTPAESKNNNLYLVVYTNADGNIISDAVKLTVNTSPEITSDPADRSKLPGSIVSFNASSIGSPVPTVQWQVSINNGAIYTDMAGETSLPLTFTTSAEQNNNLYRAVFTNSCATKNSGGGKLTVIAPLPVILTSFEVKKASGTAVVTWATEQEINCKGFEVLYSDNGIDFISLKWINGHNNSSTTNSYKYTHDTPKTGTNYYRLKQVDNDGKVIYSIIRTVSFTRNNDVSVFPNPANDFVSVTSALPGMVRIIDLSGKEMVRKQNIQNKLNINLKKFAPGVYVIQLANDEGLKTTKLLKL